jgi:uncharacterized MAPEG superfamily protein
MESLTLPIFLISLLALLGFLPASFGKSHQFGWAYLIGNRHETVPALQGWPARAERAWRNLLDYFPVFVLSILLIAWLDKISGSVVYTVWGFVLLRYLHYLFYCFGLGFARGTVWTLAMLCQLYLILQIVF